MLKFGKDEEISVSVDMAILDAVVSIAKNEKNKKSNILFLFSPNSYNDYVTARGVLSNHIRKKMPSHSQRLNSCDTTSNTVFKNIEHDFQAISKEDFDRLILTVFTKNRSELNRLARECLGLDDVNVYIL